LDVQRKTDGWNALLNAAGRYDIGVVELLIRAGADTTLRDSKGRNYIDLLKHAWDGECIGNSDLECEQLGLCEKQYVVIYLDE
jgi:hypothetical protein